MGSAGGRDAPGLVAFFIEFLKTAELFAPWVRDCPLRYQSPNAPQAIDVLGTRFLSILSGHHRYAHCTTIRTDGVNPALLGMRKGCRAPLKTPDNLRLICDTARPGRIAYVDTPTNSAFVISPPVIRTSVKTEIR